MFPGPATLLDADNRSPASHKPLLTSSGSHPSLFHYSQHKPIAFHSWMRTLLYPHWSGTHRSCGPMDKALAYGARDSRFDPWQDRYQVSCYCFNLVREQMRPIKWLLNIRSPTAPCNDDMKTRPKLKAIRQSRDCSYHLLFVSVRECIHNHKDFRPHPEILSPIQGRTSFSMFQFIWNHSGTIFYNNYVEMALTARMSIAAAIYFKNSYFPLSFSFAPIILLYEFLFGFWTWTFLSRLFLSALLLPHSRS